MHATKLIEAAICSFATAFKTAKNVFQLRIGVCGPASNMK